MPFLTIDEAALSEQVTRFYDRARLDPLLGPVFEEAVQDWPPHIQTITDFWIQAMLGGDRYRGNAFAKHQDKPLELAMFDRWLALWSETARELFASDDAERLIQRAELIGRSLKAGLFYVPGPTWPEV
jgi:hemoglobin